MVSTMLGDLQRSTGPDKQMRERVRPAVTRVLCGGSEELDLKERSFCGPEPTRANFSELLPLPRPRTLSAPTAGVRGKIYFHAKTVPPLNVHKETDSLKAKYFL
ncbi:hypothetical protein J6590_079552 [Homalodisca vitripennis]|nr:hypothetical protein J6590_079552 [Homalodisca vitripennis]